MKNVCHHSTFECPVLAYPVDLGGGGGVNCKGVFFPNNCINPY